LLAASLVAPVSVMPAKPAVPPADSPLDDHFFRPRNAGVLEAADLEVQVDNPVCGDTLKLYLRRDAGRVAEARFQVYGCPAAIAAGSVLTEVLRGRSRAELGAITQDVIAKALGGLGVEKAHAALLASDAAQAARSQWKELL